MWASDLRTQGSGCCMSPCPSPAFSSQLDHLHSCPFSILVPYIRFQWKKGLYVLKGVQKPDLHKNLHLEKRTQKSRGVIQLAHSHTVGSWHRRGPASPCPTALGQSGQWCRAQPQVTPQISATPTKGVSPSCHVWRGQAAFSSLPSFPPGTCGLRSAVEGEAKGVGSLALNSRAVENTGHICVRAIGPNLTAREAGSPGNARWTLTPSALPGIWECTHASSSAVFIP